MEAWRIEDGWVHCSESLDEYSPDVEAPPPHQPALNIQLNHRFLHCWRGAHKASSQTPLDTCCQLLGQIG